jgi:hypothetical protein
MDEGGNSAGVEKGARWIAVTAALIVAVVLIALLWSVVRNFNEWPETLRDHFATILGLPIAMSVAYVIVFFLRQADGPIEFEGLSFKFKGASGQVAMWVLCFLAIVGAIRLCWDLR